MLPIGAITKVASKASKAGKVTARAKKAGDISTNARKRYYRAAERNLKKAKESSGVTASRYRELARQNFEDALATYDPTNTQRVSQPIQKLAREFSVDIEQYQQSRIEMATSKDTRITERVRTSQRQAIFRSENVLEGNLQDSEFRSELEAREIFNSPIGSRIIGGLVDVWRNEALDANGKIDKSKILPAIQNYFGVDNLADLLDQIEKKIGEDLYKDPKNESLYDTVKITLQIKMLDNTLVD